LFALVLQLLCASVLLVPCVLLSTQYDWNTKYIYFF
jgi:hypothetical protein